MENKLKVKTGICAILIISFVILVFFEGFNAMYYATFGVDMLSLSWYNILLLSAGLVIIYLQLFSIIYEFLRYERYKNLDND